MYVRVKRKRQTIFLQCESPLRHSSAGRGGKMDTPSEVRDLNDVFIFPSLQVSPAIL